MEQYYSSSMKVWLIHKFRNSSEEVKKQYSSWRLRPFTSQRGSNYCSKEEIEHCLQPPLAAWMDLIVSTRQQQIFGSD